MTKEARKPYVCEEDGLWFHIYPSLLTAARGAAAFICEVLVLRPELRTADLLMESDVAPCFECQVMVGSSYHILGKRMSSTNEILTRDWLSSGYRSASVLTMLGADQVDVLIARVEELKAQLAEQYDIEIPE